MFNRPRHSTHRAVASVGVALLTISLASLASAADAGAPRKGTVANPVTGDTTTAVTRLTPLTTRMAPLDATSLAGLPALPRAHGFGSRTTGGAGGRLVVVTSDADVPSSPAPGTLRYALSVPGPKWVVFAKNMTIRLAAPLRPTSNTTIDGRGHAVTLTGHGVAGIQIHDVENVIVENLTLRDFGDTARTAFNDPDDAISIQRSSRVWIDHCSLSVAGDKLIGVADGADELTISWNHFAEQEQTLQIGSQSTALPDVRSTATIDHNYFDRVGYRTPVVSYGKAHVYNNYINAWKVSAVRSERLAQVFLEGNLFRVGASPKASTTSVAQVCNDKKTLCDPRSGYLTGVNNMYIGKASVAETGRGHVFDPAKAYDYVAERPSLTMGQRIAELSGAHENVVAAASPRRPVARVTAALHGRNTRRGADVLAISTRSPVRTGPTVKVSRRVGSHWHTVRYVRLSRSGSSTVVLRDRRKRSATTYRATLAVSGRMVATNLVRLR